MVALSIELSRNSVTNISRYTAATPPSKCLGPLERHPVNQPCIALI